MKQGIQDTLKHDMLAKYGCYFLSLCQWAAEECTNDEDFTEERLVKMYDFAVDKEWIKKDCTILFAPQILNLAFSYLDDQEAAMRGEALAYSTAVVTNKAPVEMKHFVIYQTKPGYGHFTLGREDGGTWDPLPPDRSGAANYTIKSYRKLF